MGQALRMGVSPQAVSLVRTSRWRGAPWTVLAEQAIAPSALDPHDAVAQALRVLLDQHQLQGWPASVVLDQGWSRMWRVTPPAGAGRLADLEGAAGLRFQALYGEPPSAWRISADWDAQRPFFAAAVPRVLLEHLELVARERRLALVAIEPHFVAAWNRWRRSLKPGAWFGLVHGQLLTLAVMDAQGMLALRPLPVPQGAGHDWLAQAVAREALLQDVQAPPMLQLCGAVPGAWLRADGGALQCAALEPARGGADARSAAVRLACMGGAA
jgi:hypothetical protein